jgi:ElaA protein
MVELKWFIKSFKDLNSDELFDMYYLRQEVFVVEQNCPYQDCDEKDKNSFHLLAYDGEILVAYLRIVEPGISYDEPSIGRVVTKSTYRGKGLGKLLMEKGIEQVLSIFIKPDLRISAQQYLIPFYESLMFTTVGDGYLEDDIPHIEMIYNPK